MLASAESVDGWRSPWTAVDASSASSISSFAPSRSPERAPGKSQRSGGAEGDKMKKAFLHSPAL